MSDSGDQSNQTTVNRADRRRPHPARRRHQALRRAIAAPAVDNITLEIPAGEIVMLVGPSGCGKTTTMKMINRLIEPTSGRILIGDDDVTHRNPDELRRHIGYVIQGAGLFPHLTVGDNIAIVPAPAQVGQEAHRRTRRRTARSREPRARRSTATATRANCPAVSSSASAWRARWPPTRRCC